MTAIIKCKTCGCENIMGQLFCRQCGTRLKVAGPVKVKKLKGAGGRFVKRVLRLIISLACIGLVVLLLWPVEPSGAFGSERHADVYERKLDRLNQAAREGYSTVEELSEVHVNGYLARVLSNSPGGESDGRGSKRLSIVEINAAFKSDHIVLFILADWGPVSLSYELTAVPYVDDGLKLDIKKLRLGHMALPSFLQGRVLQRMAVVFSHMDMERYILEHLKKIKIDDGRVILTT